MKTEHIQILLAVALVAMMLIFMSSQTSNKVLYVTFPLKQTLEKDAVQKLIQSIVAYGYQLEPQADNSAKNCITITKDITNSVCLSKNAIRIETTFKEGQIEDQGGGNFQPSDDESAVKFNHMNMVRSILLGAFLQNGIQHHAPEYSW